MVAAGSYGGWWCSRLGPQAQPGMGVVMRRRLLAGKQPADTAVMMFEAAVAVDVAAVVAALH